MFQNTLRDLERLVAIHANLIPGSSSVNPCFHKIGHIILQRSEVLNEYAVSASKDTSEGSFSRDVIMSDLERLTQMFARFHKDSDTRIYAYRGFGRAIDDSLCNGTLFDETIDRWIELLEGCNHEDSDPHSSSEASESGIMTPASSVA